MLSLLASSVLILAAIGVQATSPATEGSLKARAFGHHDAAKRHAEIAVERDLSNITSTRSNKKKQGLDWGQDAGPLANFVVKGAPVYNW